MRDVVMPMFFENDDGDINRRNALVFATIVFGLCWYFRFKHPRYKIKPDETRARKIWMAIYIVGGVFLLMMYALAFCKNI